MATAAVKRKAKPKKTRAADAPRLSVQRRGGPRWYGQAEAEVFGRFYFDATCNGGMLRPPEVAREVLKDRAHPLRRIAHLASALENPDSVLIEWLTECITKMAYSTIVIPEHIVSIDPQNLPRGALVSVPDHIEQAYMPSNGDAGGFRTLDILNSDDAEALRRSMLWHFDRMAGYTDRYAERYPVWSKIRSALAKLRGELERVKLVTK